LNRWLPATLNKMYKFLFSLLLSFSFLLILPISVTYAAGFGAYAIRTGTEYNNCIYPGQFYFGSWAGVNGCKGGDWTLNLCAGSWCPALNRTVWNDQPQYSYNFEVEDDFTATVEPRFSNGTNTPDGAVFDHWETRSINDYGGTRDSQLGTTLPANITIHHPFHNGLWFFYKSPPPPASPPAYTTPAAPTCNNPANNATNVNPNSVIVSWGSSTGASYYYYRLDNLTTGEYDRVVKDAMTTTADDERELNLGTTYQYRVWARNNSPTGSTNAYSPTTTCKFTTMGTPAIGSLSISASPDDGASSAGVRMSGLKSDQGGQNMNNAILVSRNNISNMGTVALIGAALTGSSLRDNSLYELTKSAQENKGVVLVYAADSTSTYGYSTPFKTASSWDSMITFNKGGYYAYSGATGEWMELATTQTSFNTIYNMVWQATNTRPDAPAFNVRFKSPLSNRTWKTYGYVRDIAGNHSVQPF